VQWILLTNFWILNSAACGKALEALILLAIDTTIINAFRLSEHHRKATLSTRKDKVRSAHRAFREALVSELLQDLYQRLL
jgi:hypothetical protein